MATMSRSRGGGSSSLLSSPLNRNQQQGSENVNEQSLEASPYSLSNEDMNQLTDEFDMQGQEDCDDMTTSGRTYEELVNASSQQEHHESATNPRTHNSAASAGQRHSMMSEETEESEEFTTNQKYTTGRQSVGFMLGRNSLSNWSTVGGGPLVKPFNGEGENANNDIPSSVQLEQMNTGRKSNVSRHSLGGRRSSLETPGGMGASHVNVSQRRSAHVQNSRGGGRSTSAVAVAAVGQARLSRPSHKMASHGGRRSNSLNVSHISSSSSSGMMDVTGEEEETMMGESWSPIRTSLDNSFAKSVVDNQMALGGNSKSGGTNLNTSIGQKRSGSLSPIRGRDSNSLSSMKNKSPTRSPKATTKSPTRSPSRSPLGKLSSNGARNRSISPKRASLSPKKKTALSPNGTYSLKEAEGTLPTNAAEEDGSSNMSVSSGSQTTTSSATLLTTQSQASVTKTKLVLPSLGSVRKESSIPTKAAGNVQNTSTASQSNANATQDQDDANNNMMLSPEKNNTVKNHIRSPAPTPNSQRRVIKRFRASIPTANYLMPEDIMEESIEKNPSSRTDKRNVQRESGVESVARDQTIVEAEEEAAKIAEEPAYENTFEFPANSIPVPSMKTLTTFHDMVIANGSKSHQYQLNKAGTNLLSLQEVILPSIEHETANALKKKQAKAQLNIVNGLPDAEGKEVVKVIETCRRVLKKCTDKAMHAAGEACRKREAERERLCLERLEAERDQQRLDDQKAKKERKEARARSRQQRYERQKLEKQRNHPRNKALWQEVAKLMVDIQKLEKGERLWKEASVEVKRLEEHHQPPEQMELDSVVSEEEKKMVKDVKEANLESTATTLVQDVTMATERINWMLKSVSLAMEESDKLRQEAYDKYQYEGHKFFGYPQVDNSKSLFMALSMESPMR